MIIEYKFLSHHLNHLLLLLTRVSLIDLNRQQTEEATLLADKRRKSKNRTIHK
jgi:hypothetical protein